ncbi:dead helicase [Fusarium sporotrichioides]|uniref:Dead helicase n=1 Tax=Fusarium sporotrichioides TaxID=5514 RepID=A0A395STX1_FUSSP|nr:dead helicase [Fusarium sporotrichioides]
MATLHSADDSVDAEYYLAVQQLELQCGAQDLMVSEEDQSSTNRQFRGVQNLVGEFLPQHDLQAVCEILGIPDWKNLELNPEHAPGKKLKPDQLTDAYDLHLKLESVIHAAFLTSECGIGKTDTMLACLRISVQLLLDKWEPQHWPVSDDERVFKPTVYICPSSVLDQTYQEFSDCCTIPARKKVTLGSLKEAQAIFDTLAKEHKEPLTARTIVLCAYRTAIRQFATDNGEADNLKPDDLELQDELGDDEAATLRKVALKGVQLYRLILDEGHAVKNVRSAMNQVLQQLDYDDIMIASATTLSYHVRDFYGCIKLIWDKHLPFSWDPVTSEKADTWYDIATWKKLVQGYYTADIEADRIFRDTEDEDVTRPEQTPRQQRRVREYTEHIKERGEPLSLINPQLFYSFANMSQHSHAFAKGAIRTIMQMLCPGKCIPSLNCNEVEFDLPETVKGKSNNAIMRLHANLTVQGPRRKKFKSAHGAKIGGAAVQLNENALRRMVLASTNVHNLKMTSPIVRTAKLLKDVNIQKIIGHKISHAAERLHNVKTRPLLTPSVDDNTQALMPLQERRREALQR